MVDDEKKEEKQARLRSRLYPRYDLEEAIKFIQSIQRLGGSRVSNQAVAAEVGKGVTNSGFTGRISSAKQFGLLIQESGKLTISSLGREILIPRGDAEKTSAIKQALTTPEVYKELVGDFGGKNLPDQSTLANRLYHDYRIEEAAKDSAARNFIRSVQYANVLRNGILVLSSDDGQTPPESEEEPFMTSDTPTQLPNVLLKQPQRNVVGQGAVFQDSGEGWAIIIKSSRPLNSETKKKLIEVAELLDKVNEKPASGEAGNPSS